MQKPLWSLKATLVVVLIAAWVGGWVMPVAGAKKPPPPPAPVQKTGQTTSYAEGDDGNLKVGVAWPIPRFTDRGDGTVRDNLTGLVWLKDASCIGSRTWTDALAAVADLNVGTDFDCEDYPAGTFANWRLPNVNELRSLVDVDFIRPALPSATGTAQWTEGNAFSGVQVNVYWSSTTLATRPDVAWFVHLEFGHTGHDSKEFSLTPYWVWPVRGGD